MFCSKCGAKLRDGAQFCSSCGKKIAGQPGNSISGTLGPPSMKPQEHIPPQGQGAPLQRNAPPQAVQSQNQAAFEQNQMKREQAAAAAETWDNPAISSDRGKKSGHSWVMAAAVFILILCGAGAGVLFYFISGIGEPDPLKDSSGYESMEPEDENMPGEETTKQGEEADSSSDIKGEETTAAETAAAADPS